MKNTNQNPIFLKIDRHKIFTALRNSETVTTLYYLEVKILNNFLKFYFNFIK
jgi:hypothetical protein